MRTLRATLITCALALGLLGFVTPAALAHAALESTDPADGAVLEQPPRELSLTFNEPVTPVADAIRLFSGDEHSEQLPAQARDRTVRVELPRELPNGPYTLGYRVVSADGHPISGVLTFSVGEGRTPPADSGAHGSDAAGSGAAASDAHDPEGESAATAVTGTILSAAQYLGLVLLAGTVIFARTAGRHVAGFAHRWAAVAGLGLTVAAVASLTLIPVHAVRVAGLPLGHLADTAAWWPLLSPATVVAAGLVLVAGSLALRSLRAGQRGADLGMLAAAGALVAPVLVGHTRTVAPAWLMAATDLVHLAVAAVWLGGLVGLSMLFTASRTVRARGRHRIRRSVWPRHPRHAAVGSLPRGEHVAVLSVDDVARAVHRFSRLALWSVLVLAASGVLMAWLVLSPAPGSWSARLVGGEYGRMLLLKLAAVAVAVGLATLNRFRVLPSVDAAPTEARAWRMLRRLVAAEALVLVLVLAITAVLTGTSPRAGQYAEHPAATASHAVELSGSSQGLTVVGTLEPGQAGANTATIRLTHDGKPVPPEQLSVSASLPAQRLGPITAKVTSGTEPGRARVTIDLPVAGAWELTLSARIDKFTTARVVLPAEVTG